MSPAQVSPAVRAGDTSSDRRAVQRRLAVFFGLAALLVVADQLSKSWVDGVFGLTRPRANVSALIVAPTDVIDGYVRIAKTYNDGALFGSFGSSATVFAIGSIAVIAVIVWYETTRAARGPWLLTLALSLLLGGAIGNLIDRLRFGYVVDFVDMGIGGTRWFVYNIADACISISIVLLLVVAVFGDRLGMPVPGSEAPPDREGTAP